MVRVFQAGYRETESCKKARTERLDAQSYIVSKDGVRMCEGEALGA